MKCVALLPLLFLALPASAVTVSWTLENPGFLASTELQDVRGNALPIGSLIEVGIGAYDTGTGQWTGNFTTIATASLVNGLLGGGDQAGYVSTSVGFDAGPSAAQQTPPGGTLVAIRFHNTADGSGAYNTVVRPADAIWTVPTITAQGAGPVPESMNLFNATFSGPSPDLIWEDSANPFQTTIPEPSSALLGLLALFSVLMRRRR